MCPSDTTPEAWRVYIGLLRKMPPAEKLRQALELSGTLMRAAENDFRRRHPDAGGPEVFLGLARLRLGPEIFERVYGAGVENHEPARPAA